MRRAQIFLKLFPREVFQLYMAAGYSFATIGPGWQTATSSQPPTTKKSLKSLVLAAGGKVDSVQRFALSRDEVLTYYAAQISPRRDQDGNELLPNLPRTVNRKAWLLPVELFGNEDTPLKDGGDSGDSGCPGGGSDSTPNPATAATACYQKTVASQNPCDRDVSAIYKSLATAATKKIDETETEQTGASALSQSGNCSFEATNSGSDGSTVAFSPET